MKSYKEEREKIKISLSRRSKTLDDLQLVIKLEGTLQSVVHRLAVGVLINSKLENFKKQVLHHRLDTLLLKVGISSLTLWWMENVPPTLKLP